jgi:hypothetical protein
MTHIEVRNDSFDLIFRLEGSSSAIAMKCSLSSDGFACANGQSTEKLKRGRSYWQ